MPTVVQNVSLLCDDIRTETGQKVSIMGVYGREIRVKGSEAHIPRLSIYKRLESDDNRTYSALLDVLGPTGKSVLGKAPPEMKDLSLRKEVNFGVGVGPLHLKEAGEYTVRLTLRTPDSPDLMLDHKFVLVLNHDAS